MKRLTILICLMAGALCLTAKPKSDTAKDSVGLKWLDSSFATYQTIQNRIYSYAEMGYLEFRSSKELASHLESEGFTIEWGVGEIPTAFVATYGSGHPCVGILGEYDALGGMSQDTVAYRKPVKEGAPGHACGHNILGTAGVAGAVAISKWLGEGHSGCVKFFGCPAEENGSGKHYLTVAHCFDPCDVVLDWHPSTRNQVTVASGLAYYSVEFTFHGKSAHAGGAPWDGRSALDGVESFNYMMNMMREHVPSRCRVHYIILNGGQAVNIVPEYAKVGYFFRAPNREMAEKMLNWAIDAANGAAAGTQTKMTYEIMSCCYDCLYNYSLSNIMLSSLKKVGGIKLDERERKFLEDIIAESGMQSKAKIEPIETFCSELELPKEKGGSTDVGHVSQVVPLASLRYGAVPEGIPSHSWQFASILGTTLGTKTVINVGKIFYLTALELYKNPTLLQGIREEYERVQGKDYRFRPMMDRRPPLDLNK